MTVADRYEEYVAKAKKAEKEAENAKDDRTRYGWIMVAAGYRDLATMAEAERRGDGRKT